MRRRFFLGASLSVGGPRPVMAQGELGSSQPTPVRFSLGGTIGAGEPGDRQRPARSLVALDGRPLRVTQDGRFTFGFAPDRPKLRW